MAEKVKRAVRDPNTLISMLAVLLVAILCQSSGAESPALPYMSEEFSDIPYSTITMVTTLPSIMMIPTSLAYSALRRKFSFRSLFIAGSILLIVGGVMPSQANDFTTVCVWRAIFGVGVGIMWPLAQSMIVELYHGTKQNTMLGFNSVVTACGGIIWANVGGILALQGWRISFYTYLIPIVVLIFCAIFMPRDSKDYDVPEENAAEETAEVGGAKKGYIGVAVVLLICYFFYNFCNMTYFTNLSMKVVGDGIGDSASAGLAQSMFTVGSLVIGVVFGFVMKAKFMQKYAMGLGWLLTGVGMMVVATAGSFEMVCVGSVIQGLGTGTFMPVMVGLIGNIGGKKNASVIIGISTCVMGASQYFGPTIFNMIVESLNMSAGGPCMQFAAWVHLAFAIVTIVVLLVVKNKKKAADAPTTTDAPAA